jgi:hypothetical protein
VSNSVTPPPSPPNRSSHGHRYQNHGTMLPSDPRFSGLWREMARRHALPHAEAYAIARAADRLRDPQAQIGYRLYWMSDKILGSIDVYAQPSGYAVVGRHGSCDVVLDDERVISLRHVIVRASSLDDGLPVLSVLDLHSTDGFELSDGSKQRSVAASGPVVFRIGTHSLVALPSAGRCPDVLPVPHVEAGPAAEAEAAQAAQARAAKAPPVHRAAPVRIEPGRAQEIARPIPRHRSPDEGPVSRITLLTPSVDLSRRSSVEPSPFPASYVPTGEGYEVVVASHDGRRAGVRLTNTDLDYGVLIGRAEKCVDAGLRSILVDAISRVHVLLIREKGECRLYDVASLIGTFVNGERVRCHPLADMGTTVQLASASGVTLHWRAL